MKENSCQKVKQNRIVETYRRENTTIHIIEPCKNEIDIDCIIKEYQDIAWNILQKSKKK